MGHGLLGVRRALACAVCSFKIHSHKLRGDGVKRVAQGWSLVLYTAARDRRTQESVPHGCRLSKDKPSRRVGCS